MPRELPEEIRDFTQDRMPSRHRLLWVRCEFLSSQDIERPPLLSDLLLLSRQGRPIMDTRLTVGDLDNEGEGYDVRLIGVGHDFAPDDTLSLLGHEPAGKNRLTKPRLLFNHNTGRYYRVWPDLGNFPHLTALDYKYVLSCRTLGTPGNRLRDLSHKLDLWYLSPETPLKRRISNGVCSALLGLGLFKFLGLILAVHENPYNLREALGPLLLVGLLVSMGSLMVAISLCFYIGIRIRQAIFEPPRFRRQREYSFWELMGFDNVSNYLKYTYSDITYLYEDVCRQLGAWVEAHPDTHTPFIVGLKRQTGEKGIVAETPPLLNAPSPL